MTPQSTITSNRRPIHTRSVRYSSFLREDNHWDIEGTLVDTKSYDQTLLERGLVHSGDPIHHMTVSLSINDDFIILEAHAQMPTTPFEACQPARAPISNLVGAKLGKGWRKSVDACMGGEAGCTHMRELLYGMATAAIQTVGRYRAHQRRQAGLPEPVMVQPRAPLGECLGWAFDGSVVQRFRPQFFGWKADHN